MVNPPLRRVLVDQTEIVLLSLRSAPAPRIPSPKNKHCHCMGGVNGKPRMARRKFLGLPVRPSMRGAFVSSKRGDTVANAVQSLQDAL
jgi:hypothetical protein